jgi:serine phosphatase RsbU (regulator of sigma subunit)/anti-sigma regulatory factor (Ser/Thr protein kinase)
VVDKISQDMAIIQSAWRALGGHELVLIDLEFDQAAIVKDDSLTLPEEVRAALHTHSKLDGVKLGERYWWVIFPDPPDAHHFALLASASRVKGGVKVLESWMQLLANREQESDIAESSLRELTIAWDRLHFLFQLSQIANRSSSLDEILDSIVSLLAGIVSVEEVFLIAFNEGEYRTAVNSGETREIDPALIERVLQKPTALGLNELNSDLDGLGAPDLIIRDVVIKGFTGPAKLIRGVLGVINPAKGKFDASDIQLLNSVAEQVGAIVEAAWIQIRIHQQDRLERELQIATQIQSSLLPRNFPQIVGIEIATYLEPAREMGGDFYDVAYASNGSPFLMLGDVAGKGIPASIMTALVHAAFHSESIHWVSPNELIQAMNQLIYRDLDRAGTFVSAIVVRLESDPLRFEYAAAGMGDLLLWNSNDMKCRILPPTGLPLGIDQDMSLRSRIFHLSPGDFLLCNSDGLTEAVNESGEALGVHHLSDIISIAHQASPEVILDKVLEGFKLFTGQQDQLDDVAVMLVKAIPDVIETMALPFSLPVSLSAAKQLQTIVKDSMVLAQEHGVMVSTDFSDEVTLALTEVFTNQVEHAYSGGSGLITGQIRVDLEKVSADLYDRGQPPAESPKMPPMDVSNPLDRGYGLRLIEGLVDHYEYRNLDDGRNRWHLEKFWDG